MSKLREYLESPDVVTGLPLRVLQEINQLLTEEEAMQDKHDAIMLSAAHAAVDDARQQLTSLREQVSRITDTLDDAHNSENCHTQHSCYYGVANAIMELRAAVSIGEAK